MDPNSAEKERSATFASDPDKMPHLVDRGVAIKNTSHDEQIAGYDSELMSGRSLLSKEEEKKLLRRVDLRLMPLLALILMVKNLDANNVSQIVARQRKQLFLRYLGCQCSNHEPWNPRKHPHAAQYE